MASILIIEDEPPIPARAAAPSCSPPPAPGGKALERGQEPGANEYVTKPFNLLQLAALIRRRFGDAK